jgi:hypothetical protein
VADAAKKAAPTAAGGWLTRAAAGAVAVGSRLLPAAAPWVGLAAGLDYLCRGAMATTFGSDGTFKKVGVPQSHEFHAFDPDVAKQFGGRGE